LRRPGGIGGTTGGPGFRVGAHRQPAPQACGNRTPEFAATQAPSSRQRWPRPTWQNGRLAPEFASRSHTIFARARSSTQRSTTLRPPRGGEGRGRACRRESAATAALVPLARAAAQAFRDRNSIVDVDHAARRLAAAKVRYGMSDRELEQYVRTAPDQPGLFRAGFPFGAAFSRARIEPWLEKHRRRRQSAPDGGEVSSSVPLSARELATRGSIFLSSLSRGPSGVHCCGAQG